MKKINYLVLMAAMLLMGTTYSMAKTWEVGTTETFTNAWSNAASGDVIKLTDAVSVSATLWLGTQNMNDASRSIEIDLNGNDLTSTATYAFMLTHGALKISNSNAASGGKLIGDAGCKNVFYITGSTNKDVDPSQDGVNYFSHLEIAEDVIVTQNVYNATISVDGFYRSSNKKGATTGNFVFAAQASYIPSKPELTYITNVYATAENSASKCVANGVRVDLKGTINGTKYGIKTNGYLGSPDWFYKTNSLESGAAVLNPSTFIPSGYRIYSEDTQYSPYVYIHPTGRITVNSSVTGTGEDNPVGIYASGYARWKVEGYAEGCTGAVVKSGAVDFTDATIVGTGNEYNPAGETSSGNECSGSAIVIASSASYAGDIDVTIGGDSKISASNGYAVDEAVVAADGNTKVDALTITGGTFEGGTVPVDPEDPSQGTMQGTIQITETTVEAAADPEQETTITIVGGQVNGEDADAVNIGGQTLAEFLEGAESEQGSTHIVSVVDESTGKTTIVIMQGETADGQEEVAGHDDESVDWKHASALDDDPMTENITADLTLAELQINQDYAQTLTVTTGNTLTVGKVILGPKAQIIVQPGAMFKVTDKQGVVAKSASNIILESNATQQATFLFNPDVTSNRNPNATVRLTTDCKQTHKSPWEYVYQRFAIPVMEGVAPTNNFDPAVHGLFPGQAVFETYGWRWTGTAWTTIASWASLKPFTGYQLANSSANGGVQYTFQGELVGNINGVYDFNKTVGFFFFGNSYTGAMDIETLLLGFKANTPGMEVTVWPYVESALNWKSVTLDDIEDGLAAATYINSMDGFILKLNSGTANPSVNYADAIWGNPIYAGGSPAPARARSLVDNSVVISVTAAGMQAEDQVTIVERADRTAAFENGADASKYMNPETMNIYADAPAGMLSRVATNNIVGTQISFQAANAEVYTLTLSHVNGSDYAIRDNVTGAMINLSEGTTYTFRQDAYSTVNGRFEIVGLAKVPTAIENAEVATSGKGIYTALGQYVGEKDAWSALPAGVYIVDGVKMVK